ncbi:uncharacterized protein K02A2.6-like [Armigeres subalbatus]|uniref:uncharacterized protein K02A2.6-like n=1 Tax=Armigeres subalbatus TaxID=124917 RepID=UPI002ED5D5FA
MSTNDELASGGAPIAGGSRSGGGGAPAVVPQQNAAAPFGINSSIPFPAPLKLDGNMKENVDNFRDSFDIYLIASGLELRDERVKIATFKAALGLEARKIFNLWPLTPQESNTVGACLRSLSKYMVPQKDVKLARYEFFQCRQQPASEDHEAESVMHFINRARELVKDCNFGNLEDEMLRDSIITGILDTNLKKRFIEQPNLTSAMVIAQCQTEEATRLEMVRHNWLQPTTTHSVNKLDSKKMEKKCTFCGKGYHVKLAECPARGALCNYCNQRNHFAVVCRKKKEDQLRQSRLKSTRKPNSIRTVEREDRDMDVDYRSDESNEAVQYLYQVKRDGGSVLQADVTFFNVNNHPVPVKCILDSGASCNVIGKSGAIQILGTKKLKLDNEQTVLRAFGGGSLKSLGRTVIPCEHRGQRFKMVFHVVDFEQPPLLSKDTCLALKLIKLCFSINAEQTKTAEQIVKKYPEVFEGLGKFDGAVNLEVDVNIKPSVQHPRRVAVTLRNELERTLNDMEQQGVICKQEDNTDWVSNIVLVKRNNKIRVCLDPIVLNKALKRPHYPMPTVNEILPELTNAKVFSTLDAKCGFWQVCLDEQSSKLTTFWTPFGRYRWLRMPFGISPAPEIFQKKLHEALHGLRGVRALADDILIFGCGDTIEEAVLDHNRCLEALFIRVKQQNIKLNVDKVKLCQENVKFFGHVLTPAGVKVDPDKISSIIAMESPKDMPALQRFLGTITYLTNYLPSLSTVAEPLRRLTNKDEPWTWNYEQECVFMQLKSMVTSAPVLRYFDSNKDVVIQCDSSSVGLGAVLMQDGHPIVYASKTLSSTERKYAQIEKETLAILFACRKFELYILGKPVMVETDHQPLIRIFKKPLVEAPLRIQRMLLALQRYQITLRFTPGKEVVIADMLSRAALSNKDTTDKEMFDIYEAQQINVIDFIPISDERVEQITIESCNDPEIQTVIHYIIDGWPNKNEIPEGVKVYWPYRDEFSTHNGLVYRNDRILVPKKLRGSILKQLHQSHSGIEATVKLARDTVFWPGLNDQIRQTVQNCEVCLKFSANQQAQPMQSHQIPCYPFQKVSMDLFEVELDGRKSVYLTTVDHYSDYFEIDELKAINTGAVIVVCKRNFARFGKPQIVTTDNGVQFVSTEFRKFAADWGFQHTTSAPYHQQANGKAESAVKIAKSLLKKASESKQDFWEVLLQWRNTPNKVGSSPVQRLMNRRTRFGVPMGEQKYLPKIEEGVKEKLQRNRQEAKLNYDRNTKVLPSLEIGQPVFVKKTPTEKEWTRATVVDPVSDRSTIVAVGDQEYRRDNVMIRPAPRPALQIPKQETIEHKSQESPTHRPPSEHSFVTSPGGVDRTCMRPQRITRLPRRFDDYETY